MTNHYRQFNRYRPPHKAQSAPERRAWRKHVDILVWRYGAALAELMLSGRDPATEADIRSWRGLGVPK